MQTCFEAPQKPKEETRKVGTCREEFGFALRLDEEVKTGSRSRNMAVNGSRSGSMRIRHLIQPRVASTAIKADAFWKWTGKPQPSSCSK